MYTIYRGFCAVVFCVVSLHFKLSYLNSSLSIKQSNNNTSLDHHQPWVELWLDPFKLQGLYSSYQNISHHHSIWWSLLKYSYFISLLKKSISYLFFCLDHGHHWESQLEEIKLLFFVIKVVYLHSGLSLVWFINVTIPIEFSHASSQHAQMIEMIFKIWILGFQLGKSFEK